MAWYVVTVGRHTGVYCSWEACHDQVNGFKGACYKKYKTKDEAMEAFHG
ncbi:RNase H1/viroplasmin domain-containing protein, partial [Klebsiella pneumoniae]